MGTPKNDITIPTGTITGDNINLPIVSPIIISMAPIMADPGNKYL